MATRTNVLIEQKICKKYSDGYGTCELSRTYNLSITTISKILDRNNIFKYKGRKPFTKYNIDYFNSYSNESCYWAGFIYADGCIIDNCGLHRLSIGLKEEDKLHLIKFIDAINCNCKLSYDKNNKSYIVNISGKYFIKDLENNFNIVPNKSLVINFPQQVPFDKLPHFIRGIFDGDGSITLSKNKGIISVVGTQSTITNIIDIIYNFTNVRISKYGSNNTGKPSIQKTGNIYSASYHGGNAKKVLDWLYIDSNENTRLARKYEKYLSNFSENHLKDNRFK